MAGGEQTIMEALTAELLGDVGRLHDKVKDLNAALPDAAQVIRDAGRDAADSIHVAVGKAVAELNHSAANTDTAKIQAHFDQVAELVLAEVRKGASPAALGSSTAQGNRSKSGAGLLMIVAMTVAGLLVGGFVGSRVNRTTPDEQTSKQIEAGRDFLQVLPQLDDKTKEKLVRMIQKNREAAGN